MYEKKVLFFTVRLLYYDMTTETRKHTLSGAGELFIRCSDTQGTQADAELAENQEAARRVSTDEEARIIPFQTVSVVPLGLEPRTPDYESGATNQLSGASHDENQRVIVLMNVPASYFGAQFNCHSHCYSYLLQCCDSGNCLSLDAPIYRKPSYIAAGGRI